MISRTMREATRERGSVAPVELLVHDLARVEVHEHARAGGDALEGLRDVVPDRAPDVPEAVEALRRVEEVERPDEAGLGGAQERLVRRDRPRGALHDGLVRHPALRERAVELPLLVRGALPLRLRADDAERLLSHPRDAVHAHRLGDHRHQALGDRWASRGSGRRRPPPPGWRTRGAPRRSRGAPARRDIVRARGAARRTRRARRARCRSRRPRSASARAGPARRRSRRAPPPGSRPPRAAGATSSARGARRR